MLRHEFQPGKLVAGLFIALAGVIYAGDAGGLWETPWFAVIPVVTGGLCLAGAVGVLSRGIRRRRAAVARKAEGEAGQAPLDTPL
ncbi:MULTISPECIES: hypothetical protein [unclassified Streptomyces]|uniref:hypothetical protein n=1 Tax=unclassified Streptomyces TaxID=2593676 RepID=UPI00324DADA7